MAIRRNIGGRYVLVRERDTKKGHKGTIMGNWSWKNDAKDKKSEMKTHHKPKKMESNKKEEIEVYEEHSFIKWLLYTDDSFDSFKEVSVK